MDESGRFIPMTEAPKESLPDYVWPDGCAYFDTDRRPIPPPAEDAQVGDLTDVQKSVLVEIAYRRERWQRARHRAGCSRRKAR